jgi:UDP-N-acetylglucosamine transferase subunit ALG13
VSAPVLFASVGSMFPFDRLVKAIDDWAAAHPEVLVEVQIGGGVFVPRHARHVRMMPPALYQRRIREARLFVAHAGMGSIISAIEAGRPLLMMPRLQALGEHTTDHQLATLAKFGGRPGLHVAEDVPALRVMIDRLLHEGSVAPAPIDPWASPALIARVQDFIHQRG